MFKYIASILALSVVGCGGNVTTTAHATTPTPVAQTEETPALGVPATPITVELAHGQSAQALRCNDGLDCFQKLTGVCSNGYSGSQLLKGENDKIVAILYRCVSDEEKAEAAAEEAQEKKMEAAWKAAREARAAEALKAMQEESSKPSKPQPKK